MTGEEILERMREMQARQGEHLKPSATPSSSANSQPYSQVAKSEPPKVKPAMGISTHKLSDRLTWTPTGIGGSKRNIPRLQKRTIRPRPMIKLALKGNRLGEEVAMEEVGETHQKGVLEDHSGFD